MNDIFISPEDQSQNKGIDPIEVAPKRYAISTNILCSVKDDGMEKFLFINSDPEFSKTWYPFYTTINAFYTFESKKYGDLVREYHDEIIAKAAKDRIEKAKSEFSAMFNCGTVEVENMQRNEYWLKYSKSSNVWTIYLFEFYIATSVSDLNALKANLGDKNVLLPIGDGSDLDAVLSKGTIAPMPIVTNIIKLLNEKEALDLLLKKAL